MEGLMQSQANTTLRSVQRPQTVSKQGGEECCLWVERWTLLRHLPWLGKMEETSCFVNTPGTGHLPLKTDISFWKKAELEIRGPTESQQAKGTKEDHSKSSLAHLISKLMMRSRCLSSSPPQPQPQQPSAPGPQLMGTPLMV